MGRKKTYKLRKLRQRWTKLSPPSMAYRTLDRFCSSVESRNWSPGDRYQKCCEALAQRLDIPPSWVVLTKSCTQALAAAGHMLRNSMLPTAVDTIKVCPLTWPSTYCWAKAESGMEMACEWVDCDDQGWPVSEVDVGVELWGRSAKHCNIEWPSILDCAHRFGDEDHGSYLREGQVQALTYSFAPQKEVSCFMGGALVSPLCADGDISTYLHSGCAERTYNGQGGVNGLMPDPVAAWITNQMIHHERYQAHRQLVLSEYERHLGDKMLTRPGEASGHLAIMDSGSPQLTRLIRKTLKESALVITLGHHYPMNDEQREACPNAAALSDRIISLPCHPEMTAYDVRRVCLRIFAV